MSRRAPIPSRSRLVLFSLLVACAVPAAAAADARVSESYGKLPLHFEANQGQTHKDVRFLARGPGYGLYLTAGEAVLVLSTPNPDAKHEARSLSEGRDAKPQAQSVALRMSLVGAAGKPLVSGVEELPGKANYFIGNDPAQWRTNVPTYAKVHYREVYPGIDLVYYGNQRQLEYDFVVAPGADPKKIVLGFKGADKLEIDGEGELVLHVPEGAIRQKKPVIYQEVDGTRHEIAGGYVRKGANRVGFKLAAYDTTRPLIIDPVVLSYSTYLGGSGPDSAGRAIAVDADGNAYVTGSTTSTNFPTTAGAFQPVRNQQTCSVPGGSFPCSDAFVTKLNVTGSALVYSTYLGGSANESSPFIGEAGSAIAVDAEGNAYVTGFTTSPNFPTTAGAFQTVFGGSLTFDGFVTKLNPTGSALVYSTYLGGSFIDHSIGIAVDAHGSAYVFGSTESSDFPTTPDAFQTTRRCCGSELFVTKFNPAGSELVYSTLLGGGSNDFVGGIAIDIAGNAYLAGTTQSADFPTTSGAFQTTGGGAFVTKLNPTGSALVYSTHLHSLASTSISGIAVDTFGNAYVTGSTGSSNFPTTPGAFQPTSPSGSGGPFVTKFDPTGSALVYSTYLGDNLSSSSGIAVDTFGNAYVTGGTASTNFPTTLGAFQTTLAGGVDAFVTKLDPTGSVLVYSTYLGGSGGDGGSGIAVDAVGNAYVTGTTPSSDFPTTPGAFQPAFGGGFRDAFVAKIAEGAPDRTAPSTTASANPAPNAAGWNNSSVTVTLNAADNEGGSGVESITYSINGGAPVTVSGATASFTLAPDGVNTIAYHATDNAGNAEAIKTLVVRIDMTPPSGTLSLSPSQLWPPDRQLATITPSLTVADAGGGPVTVSGPLVSSNEPETGGGDTTAPDWVVSGETLQLRAERAGDGSGRVYTVTYTLTDQAGNTAPASSTVTVLIKR